MTEADSSGTASEEAPDDGTWSTRSKRLIVLGVVLVVIGGLALPKITESDTASGQTAQDSGPLAVDAAVVQYGTMTETIRTTGTLRADESVELTPESPGKITDIRFEEGNRVQAGDLLLQINDAELQAEKERLEHELDLATDRAERQKQLLAEGGVSEEEYDATRNEVEVLRADLNLVEAQIEKTKVHAPFDGIVGLRAVSEGAYVSPQTTITTVQRLNPMKVDFSVSEQYASRIQPGQSISFNVRGVNRSISGEVYATDTGIDAGTRTLKIRARVPNPERRLRPGMFADVTVQLGTVEDAIVVPSFAVVPTLDGQRVFVAAGGTAQPRNVELGIRTDSTVQVTNGLSLRDTLITSGIQDLRAGLPIRIETLE